MTPLLKKNWSVTPLIALLASGALFGQQADIPLNNWTVPPYTQATTGGITTMTDVTAPRAFIGITPCRVADTRGNGAPIQGGILPNSGVRNWDVTGVCGIPVGADAISVNFSVVSAAATPQGAFLLAWPTGSPPAPGTITAVMTFGPGVTILSNAAIVPLGPGEQLTVNVSHSTHVIMDVNGYFSDSVGNPANYLEVTNNASGDPAALFRNASNANSSTGVFGTAGPGFLRPEYLAAGVRGEGRVGVLGVSQEFGVWGSLVGGEANELAFGALGSQSPGGGIAGVLGQSYGLLGVAVSGVGGIGSVSGFPIAAVRGVNFFGFPGVVGLGGFGVTGYYFAAPSTLGASGYLGFSATVGVHAEGDVTATGDKSFVEPHPSDPSKVLRYIALEGNEAGTYFRGRGKFQKGLAVIEVPEDFRIVTDSEGLSIQVTPIGQMASVAVESIGLDRIVVRGSRNVEFFYTVNGIRHASRGAGPIIENDNFFVPISPEEPMMSLLPDVLKQRLISNGTYTADGKVNMETARRMGWDKIWEQRSRPTPQPTEP